MNEVLNGLPESTARRMVEFACQICIAKTKEHRPLVIGCAWRDIDKTYCPLMKCAIEQLKNSR